MKVRDLQRLGFEPAIMPSGKVSYVLPLCQLSEAGAQAVTPAQLGELMRLNIAEAGRVKDKILAKLNQPAEDHQG